VLTDDADFGDDGLLSIIIESPPSCGWTGEFSGDWRGSSTAGYSDWSAEDKFSGWRGSATDWCRFCVAAAANGSSLNMISASGVSPSAVPTVTEDSRKLEISSPGQRGELELRSSSPPAPNCHNGSFTLVSSVAMCTHQQDFKYIGRKNILRPPSPQYFHLLQISVADTDPHSIWPMDPDRASKCGHRSGCLQVRAEC
jgi:hypothetical protein